MTNVPAHDKQSQTVPPYKRYEVLTADLFRHYAPDNAVVHNDKVVGASGRSRQIDVAVRSSAPGRESFMAVECKLYKRRVGIQQVDAMIGQIQDVGADIGLIVSDSGFDRGARARARADGRIQLRHLVDSAATQLRTRLTLPICIRFVDLLLPYRLSISSLRFPSEGRESISEDHDAKDDAELFLQF